MSEFNEYPDYELGIIDELEDEELLQSGVKRRSGRYPWGSGKDGMQRSPSPAEAIVGKYDELKAKGMTDVDIAKKLGTTTTKMRSDRTIAKAERDQRTAEGVNTLIKRGEKVPAIASKLGLSESTVRNFIGKDPNSVNSKRQIEQTADALGDSVKRSKYVDIGTGVERQLGISKDKLKAVTNKMVESGDYEIHKIYIEQLTNPAAGNTTVKVLVPKGTTQGDVLRNKDKIRPVDFNLADGDATQLNMLQVPKSVSWDRLKIRYKDGTGGPNDGEAKDGTMELRPGTKDLDMGNSKYAQVRIAVGGTHYLKGMALYGDPKDFPPGVDIIFNTNKGKNKTKEEVLKPIAKTDNEKASEKLKGPDPFGASISRQNHLLDSNGKPVATIHNGKKTFKNGALNILQEEGGWADWSKSLSAQFLSKQPPKVVSEMLGKTLNKVDKDYDEIMKVTNPVVRQKLLDNYRSDLESKQVHLKSVTPKGFGAHVILPVPSMKENEVYAPNYPNGSKVILVRYPHGGTFEIPELVVNNRGPGKKIVGPTSSDAIGIHPKVASKLSGADFDGDTAYVIPNNSRKFKSRASLSGLKDFDPNIYEGVPSRKVAKKTGKGYDEYYKDSASGKEYKIIDPKTKQLEMGIASNLITDMTLRGATDAELTRAVKHSMVVIDAEKHKLDYRRSAEANAIDALKKKYQTHIDNVDYSTLKQVAKGYQSQVDTLRGRLKDKTLSSKEKTAIQKQIDSKMAKVIDPTNLARTGKTGEGGATIISRHAGKVTTGGKIVEVTKVIQPGETGNVRGKEVKVKTEFVIRNRKESYITNMIDDARVYLNKDSDIREKYYVDYVNELKSRVKKVDDEMSNYKTPKVDKKAALIYQREVKSLSEKLNQTMLNAPKERLAQVLAGSQYRTLVDKQGGEEAFEKDKLKKLKNQALVNARALTGASRTPVVITGDEWDAIQSNAISTNMLKDLTKHMNDDQLKELATPRERKTVTPSSKSRILTLINNGYTSTEIADMYGLSSSTVNAIKKDDNLTASSELKDTYFGGIDYGKDVTANAIDQ